MQDAWFLDVSLLYRRRNYKDYSHYGNWVNDQITEYIAAGKNLVTEENCDGFVDEMIQFVYGYDFEQLFEESSK